MKKLLLALLIFLYSLIGYSQFPESFENSSTLLPLGWKQYQSNTGPQGNVQFWKISSLPSYLCAGNGNNTALMDRENIENGNTSTDYLSTPRFTVPSNGQFRFFSKQVGSEDTGVIYKLQVSINPNQDFLVDYVTLKTWTETEMNAVYNVCEEKIVDFPESYYGQQVYVALVKIFTQTGDAISGDRWLVDKINVVQKCQAPTLITAVESATTTHGITWNDNQASRWDIKYGIEGVVDFDSATLIGGIGLGTNGYLPVGIGSHKFTVSALTPQTSYSYWIRSRCSDDNTSPWIGPLSFTTVRVGTKCDSPIEVSTLPYQSVSNTNLFGNFTNTIQGSGCGAIPSTTNYLEGFDSYYRYTALQTGLISVRLTPTSPRASLFIYPTCPTTGNCLAGEANSNSNVRLINNFAVTQGEDYIIVISSAADVSLSSTGYTLLIQQEACLAPVGAIPTDAQVTTSSAILNWSNPTGATNWQVSVQPFNSSVPPTPSDVLVSVSGTPTTTLSGLTQGTRLQYWVRAECTPGVFTSWSGPYPFSTDSCLDAEKCIVKFKMGDSGNNGWQGAIMQIRQNGVVVREIGPLFTSGGGSTTSDIDVLLCKNVAFDLFWSVGGLQPQQCRLEVLNNFGQTLYTRVEGPGGVSEVLFTRVVNCDGPVCDIKPTKVTSPIATISTNSAIVNWNAVATTAWDIYIVEAGNPAPNATDPASGVGVYIPNVTSTTSPFSYNLTGLLADTTYNVYVRVVCSPLPSPWSLPGVFTTLETCKKPTGLAIPTAAGTITTTSVKFTWIKGKPSDTKWELLLIPTPTTFLPPIPVPIPINPSFPGQVLQVVDAPANPSVPVQVNGLTPATIYNAYVRTVCSESDKSKWSVLKQFNTVTCATAEKCNYQIVLKNITPDDELGPNSWNGARIQIRQNGIVTQTLGASFINGLPINVPLCPGIPFDIYWSVRGSNPADLYFDFYNPFGDVINETEFDDEVVSNVLYGGTTNCLPTGCQKPTALNVNALQTTATTAQLTWTDVASTSLWEIYVTPENGIPPVNGNPLYTTTAAPITVFGTSIYFLANSNPFTVTGLLPGKKYKYYIRSVCSTTEISNWTIINPFSFITKPLNDACEDAQLVPVSTTWNCDATTETIGNTLGATASLPTVSGTGCGTTNDDVWYKFVATNSIHILNVEQIFPEDQTPVVVPLNYMLLSGDCSTLVKRICSTEELTVATGLIPGDTYYIRVYTAGSVVGETTGFTLCVGTPPAPATNDNCASAINVTVNTLSDCTIFTPGNIVGATASLPAQGAPCVGNSNDDVWFSFVANSDTQIVNLLNVQGSTNNLNHALYSGTCASLTRLTCSLAGSLQSSTKNLVIGQTYYIRVWSNEATSQVVIFDVCVKPASTCQTAAPFCGANAANPYIYQNTVGLPDTTQVACLGSIPNPTYYTLQVDETGSLAFQIVQNSSFDAAGNPIGTGYDVDFVAWGPFADTESCAQISLTDCPTCPFDNFPPTNSTFYPLGNIVDCSYSTSNTETLTIPNAVAGQFYVILVTNFRGEPGFIRLIQTNFGSPTAGNTVCCDVDLGPNVSICESSKLLSAIEGVEPDAVVPSTYTWYRNNVLIDGVTSATYTATQSGTYKVTGACGVNDVEDEMILILSPIVKPVIPSDYRLCDDASANGIETFDLTTLATQALGGLDPLLYSVTYHRTELAAIQDNNAIIEQTAFENTTSPFLQTIYIRIESKELTICYGVVPANLVVIPLPAAPVIVDVIECEKAPIQTLTPALPVGVDIEWFDLPVLGNVVNPSDVKRNLVGASTFYAETILANLDYRNTKSTVTIPAGQTSATVSIQTLSDAVTELPETFTLAGTVTSTNTASTTASGVATITDTAALSKVSITNPVCVEGTNATFKVSLSNPSVSDTTINFKTIVGTADALDFTETILTLTIPAGQTVVTATVPTLVDTITELAETFTFKGTVTSTNTINSVVSGTATITEVGSLPTVTIENTSTVEGTNALFTITLSSPSSSDTVINFETQPGSAGSIGCRSAVRTPVKLEILPAPAAPVTTPVEACATVPLPQIITANVTPQAGINIVWYDALTNGNVVTSPTLNTIGVKTYFAEAVNTVTGCRSLTRTSASLTLNDNPVFGIQGDCVGLNYTLDIIPLDNYNVATATYQWKDISKNVIIGTQSTVVVKSPGAYSCTITNDDGCSTTEVKSFNYVSCEVQKGISPKGTGQGDGKNDYLDLSNIDVTKLEIFNRYGLKVYTKENYVKEWYGQSDKGEELPDGTYYYVVEVLNEDPKTGWIYINREQ